MMERLVASGLIADIVLAAIALEALALWAYRRATGMGPRLLDLAGAMVSGAFLVLALRLALTGAGAGPILLATTGALAAHLADLARRGPWR